MSPENPQGEASTFGENLMGMQGFSATRAARYRAEMEALLVHRLTASDRWAMGVAAVVGGAVLTLGGIAIATARGHPDEAGVDAARWTVAATCALTGLLFGAWLLRIALQGGYARRMGDVMGLVIVLVFGGGWAAAIVQLGWATSDAGLRGKLLSAGAILFALLAGCLLLALLQRMHRQTQEKLVRIEYHLAELMERDGEAAEG